MIVVVPEVLSTLPGTTVPEDDAPQWAASTAYAAGDRVLRNHYIYVAMKDSKGIDPLESYAGLEAAWQVESTSNLYRALDWHNYTQTVAPEGAEEMTLVVPWKRSSTTVAFLNMSAVSMAARITTTRGEEVFSVDMQLLADSAGWWDYLFGDFRYTKNFIEPGLIPVQSTLEITLRGPRPAIGMIVVGRQYSLGTRRDHSGYGRTQYGASAQIVDYSTQEMDELGAVNYVPRFTAGRVSVEIPVHPDDMNEVQRILEMTKVQPALWIGDNGTGADPLNVFGFLKSSGDRFAGPALNMISLNIEGIA